MRGRVITLSAGLLIWEAGWQCQAMIATHLSTAGTRHKEARQHRKYIMKFRRPLTSQEISADSKS